jgi:uncharacterized tellurite resistance protein B-like protein
MSEQNTFLQQSEDVRTSYLVILGAVSTADHDSNDAEVAFMEQMGIVAQLSEANNTLVKKSMTDTASINLAEHIAKFKDNDLKFSLVTDLLNISYKDGDLEKEEVEAIKNVNNIVGISDEQFNALQQYIKTANKESETDHPVMDEKGNPKQPKANFLESTGLDKMFAQMGIPVGNFKSGTTVASTLSTGAFFLLKNYVQANTQIGKDDTLGDKIGGFLSSALGSMQTKDPKTGKTTENAGTMGMVANFFSSEMGSAAINGVLNNVMTSVEKGKGMGNVMKMLTGGSKEQGGLQNILGSLMGGGAKK